MATAFWQVLSGRSKRVIKLPCDLAELDASLDVEFSNWKLDPVVAADAFAALDAANAKKIDFAVPQPPGATKKMAAKAKAQ